MFSLNFLQWEIIFIAVHILLFHRPSDRVESPSYSSLNHSYETLNMSDTAETSSVVAQSADSNQKENAPRLPHRPAPPIPTPKYKMTAGEYQNVIGHLVLRANDIFLLYVCVYFKFIFYYF